MLVAEYPFLPGGEAALGGEPVSIGALLGDAAYEGARAVGRARVRAALADARGETRVPELDPAGPEVRFLSFLFAQIVLSAAPRAAGLRRWAVAESKRAYGRLARAGPDELEEVARRLRFSMEWTGRGFSVGLPDYVRLSTPIREADFRLPRQDLVGGRVAVDARRAARLLEEAVRRTLSDPLPLGAEVVERVRSTEAELLEEVAQRMPAPLARPGAAVGPLRPELFPPCIRRMQRTLQRGDNLSHAGRFALAAFLHRAGADADTIVDAYRGAPDFDESITRYQVEHITVRNDGRGYDPPNCETLRSHGLCARDGDPEAPSLRDRGRDERCFDERLRRPTQYYRRLGGTLLEAPDRDGDDPATAAKAPGRSAGPGRTRSTGPR